MNKQIRVLHVLGSLNCGGIENLLMNIYKNIDRTKVQFDFVIHTGEKCFFSDEILEMGGKIFVAPSLGIKSFFKYKRWWKNFLGTNSYNIIHIHMIYTARQYIKLIKNKEIKVILHSHYTLFSGSLIKKAIKKIMTFGINKYADCMFACSEPSGASIFGKKGKYSVINNGIECSKYEFSQKIRDKVREELNVMDSVVFGHVGSFSEAKNHIFLLDVFREIKKRENKAKLLLVGDGALKSEILKKIEEYGFTDDVILLGIRKDVNEILMAMDAFIFPSLYEGLGIAAIEAQATGLNCIVSDAVPVDVNVSGKVVFMPLSDGASLWAESSLNLIEYDNDRKEALKNVIENGYDIGSTTEKLQEIYLEMVRNEKR